MKKKVLFIIILIIFLGSMIGSFVVLDGVKLNKEKVKNEIFELNKKIQDSKLESTNYQEEITKLKEESKDNLEEYEIWLRAKEKLEKAL